MDYEEHSETSHSEHHHTWHVRRGSASSIGSFYPSSPGRCLPPPRAPTPGPSCGCSTRRCSGSCSSGGGGILVGPGGSGCCCPPNRFHCTCGPSSKGLPVYVWSAIKDNWCPPTSYELAGQVPLGGHRIKVYSWHLSGTFTHAYSRTACAVSMIEKDLEGSGVGYCAILLQDVTDTGLQAILEHPWIRNCFQITNRTRLHDNGETPFTITLISKCLKICSITRSPYDECNKQDDLLIVDIAVGSGPYFRLGNSFQHAGSLEDHEFKREMVDKRMNEDHVLGGVVGGNMSAFNTGTVQSLSPPYRDWRPCLKDVWIEFGRRNDIHNLSAREQRELAETGGDLGHTWGYQPIEPEVKTCRLIGRYSKILYCGKETMCETDDGKFLRRIGVGAKCEYRRGGYHRNSRERNRKGWVSEHYGLAVTFYLGRGNRDGDCGCGCGGSGC
ncbi:hypothetical protein BZA77DRAFT_364143 [Pyronema omphalodes]|nr:hypothetical protein BZA77DRAFT_364143 [Pyronema omphalodes]